MSKKSKEIADDSEDNSKLTLSGIFASQLYVVSGSTITLSTTFAENSKGEQVLLPLADWQLIGHEVLVDEDPDVAFEALIPLDNIAFLIKDMCEEYLVALQNLERLSSPSKFQAGDVAEWLNQLADIATQASQCAKRISENG